HARWLLRSTVTDSGSALAGCASSQTYRPGFLVSGAAATVARSRVVPAHVGAVTAVSAKLAAMANKCRVLCMLHLHANTASKRTTGYSDAATSQKVNLAQG